MSSMSRAMMNEVGGRRGGEGKGGKGRGRSHHG